VGIMQYLQKYLDIEQNVIWEFGLMVGLFLIILGFMLFLRDLAHHYFGLNNQNLHSDYHDYHMDYLRKTGGGGSES